MMKPNMTYTSVFARHIESYVEFKNALGYKFVIEAYMLRQFDRYCVRTRVGSAELTTELMFDWLNSTPDDKVTTRSSRVSTLKGFAEYLGERGVPVTWKPMPGHSSGIRQARYIPYIFTRNEIGRIIKTADNLPKGKATRRGQCSPTPSLSSCSIRLRPTALSLPSC